VRSSYHADEQAHLAGLVWMPTQFF